MDLTNIIFEGAKDKIAEEVAKKINLPTEKAGGAVAAAIPAIVKGLAQNASNSDGAKGILDALDRDHDGSIMDDVPGMIGKGGLDIDGAKILGHVLGSKEKDVAEAVGREAGIDAGQADSVMQVLAPIVMGYLGKQKKEKGLDADTLSGVLGGMSRGSGGFLTGMLDADGDGKISDDLIEKGMGMLGDMFKKK